MPRSLVVFSHLRWDFVYQRPQHLLQRLATHYRVYFFEEPIADAAEPYLEQSEPIPNLIVCRPHTPSGPAGFHDQQISAEQQLLKTLIEHEGLDDYGVWFYSPMALPLMNSLDPAVVIYDCMDELSAFKNAPKQLLQRESALLKVADVVFTGGPSLFRAKRQRHEQVYCFSSSVDAAHFAAALDPANEHPAMRDIPHPRIGFFGVIDERMDLDLLRLAAEARPAWQFMMVGPHVKIDPATLPQRRNIHYFGQQSYADLPRFVAGWDVCMQPFALNEATRFISPTKTLEYMAAEKPIVSTPITDVVEPYQDIVYIADDTAAFIECCERALGETELEVKTRVDAMRATIAKTSWDKTAAAMQHIIESIWESGIAAEQRPAAHHGLMNTASTGRAEADSATAAALKSQSLKSQAASPAEFDAIVIGAGPTGLSAGYHLGERSLVLEQNSTVGGWCRSLQDSGFTFDYAGHIMFSNDEYVHSLYKKLLGDNIHWQNREAWVYSKHVFTRYPFQGALYGLPVDVVKDCIIGAIEAHFGPLKSASEAPGSKGFGSSPAACKAESITDCCGDGVAETVMPAATFPRTAHRPAEFENFEDFIYRVWGAGVARHFAIPYNKKIWAVPLNEMDTSWLGGRVPLPNLEEMIDGALRPVAKPQGPNARFGYPLRGGFQALMNGFMPLMRGQVLTNSKVTQINIGKHIVTLANGRQFRYRKLISTAPLPVLIKMLGESAPVQIRNAASKLRHTSVRCVNIGVARENISDKHWIYYPEDTVFHRIFLQGNASPHCNAPGGFALTCEISYAKSKPLPCDGDELIDRCIRECIEVGLLRTDDRIIARNQVDMPFAYVIYDMERKKNVKLIQEWLQARDILLSGRYSEWEYYNSDHAFIAGKKAADRVRDMLCSDADLQSETATLA